MDFLIAFYDLHVCSMRMKRTMNAAQGLHRPNDGPAAAAFLHEVVMSDQQKANACLDEGIANVDDDDVVEDDDDGQVNGENGMAIVVYVDSEDLQERPLKREEKGYPVVDHEEFDGIDLCVQEPICLAAVPPDGGTRVCNTSNPILDPFEELHRNKWRAS